MSSIYISDLKFYYQKNIEIRYNIENFGYWHNTFSVLFGLWHFNVLKIFMFFSSIIIKLKKCNLCV